MEILGFIGVACLVGGIVAVLGRLIGRTGRNTGAAHGGAGFRSYDL
jgi:hypothetical protein